MHFVVKGFPPKGSLALWAGETPLLHQEKRYSAAGKCRGSVSGDWSLALIPVDAFGTAEQARLSKHACVSFGMFPDSPSGFSQRREKIDPVYK